MPKIIENLPQRLTEEARRQVEQSGYGALTVRSVARACGVGVGTVYNYYPSKDALVAAFMLEDWTRCVESIQSCAQSALGQEPVLWAIYETLEQFMDRNAHVLRDEAAARSFTGAFGQYHRVLRSQLAQPVRRFCRDDFTAEFVAEALLIWTVNGKSFEEVNGVLKRVF